MHPLERLAANPKPAARAIAIWFTAPFAPLFLGGLAQMLGASETLTLAIVNHAASFILLALLPLSVWGGVAIEDWLREAALPPSGLTILLSMVLSVIAFTAETARTPPDLPGLKISSSSAYRLMLTAWTVLIAYQLKAFWDHAKEVWRKERWRVFLRETTRPYRPCAFWPPGDAAGGRPPAGSRWQRTPLQHLNRRGWTSGWKREPTGAFSRSCGGARPHGA